MLKTMAIIALLTLSTINIYAQEKLNNFLSEELSIKDYKLNTTLSEFKKIKSLNDNLSIGMREDNTTTFILSNQNINFLGLVYLDKVILHFDNNKLNSTVFEVEWNLVDIRFEKTYNILRAKYGEPISHSNKNSLYKTYVWDDGISNILLKHLKTSFLINYSGRTLPSNLWIYKNRKGEGKDLIQYNLAFFEKLINSNLTISVFENQLPAWESAGAYNHITYSFDRKTKAITVPQYRIDYKLKNYDIEITTDDTTNKIITNYDLKNINNPNIIKAFKEELNILNFKNDSSLDGGTKSIYENLEKRITVMFEENEIDISKY